MLRRIESHIYNSNRKQFYCKNCKVTTDVIYKDDHEHTWCPLCVPTEILEQLSQKLEEDI